MFSILQSYGYYISILFLLKMFEKDTWHNLLPFWGGCKLKLSGSERGGVIAEIPGRGCRPSSINCHSSVQTQFRQTFNPLTHTHHWPESFNPDSIWSASWDIDFQISVRTLNGEKLQTGTRRWISSTASLFAIIFKRIKGKIC